MRRPWIPVLLLTLLLGLAPPARAVDVPLSFTQLRALWSAWTTWLLGPAPGRVVGQEGVYIDPLGGSPRTLPLAPGPAPGRVVGQEGSYIDPYGGSPRALPPAPGRVVGQQGSYIDPDGSSPHTLPPVPAPTPDRVVGQEGSYIDPGGGSPRTLPPAPGLAVALPPATL